MKVLITPRGFSLYGHPEIQEMENHELIVDYNDTGKAYTPLEFLNKAQDADGIIVGVDIIDKNVIDQCPNLKVICKFGVGTDNIDVKYAESKGIYVGRTVGTNSNAVAEHVISLIMNESKNIYKTIAEVKDKQWNKPTGIEVTGKTLGIVGFGEIGKHLAKHATGLGMEVIVNDVQTIPLAEINRYKIKLVDFHELVSTADYISLHLPLLSSTKNLFSTKEFKAMKETASLINSARGGIVDESALYQALVNKEIRSASFDVFSTEPPKVGEPLLSLDNFFLTPHTAARTAESEERTCQLSTKIILNQLLKV